MSWVIKTRTPGLIIDSFKPQMSLHLMLHSWASQLESLHTLPLGSSEKFKPCKATTHSSLSHNQSRVSLLSLLSSHFSDLLGSPPSSPQKAWFIMLNLFILSCGVDIWSKPRWSLHYAEIFQTKKSSFTPMEGGYRMCVWRAVSESVIIVGKKYW